MSKNKSTKKDLKERLTRAKAKTLEKEKDLVGVTHTRQANLTYQLLDDHFRVKENKAIQYASAYFIRLESLRELLIAAAASRWPKCEIAGEIVNVKPNSWDWVIIGTLFKEMKNKPMLNLEAVTILGKNADSYVDPEDTMLIEDHSGRMKIFKNEIMNPGNFVTGAVLALKGRINSNGLFEATDFTYPGVPSVEKMPEIYNQHMDLDEETKEPRGLFEDLENREFVAFVSGLEFGTKREMTTTALFTRWLLGQYGNPDERLLSSKISRLVIGGNNIGEESDIDEVIKGSFRTHEINERVYTNLADTLEQFEAFLLKTASHCDVDVMPGDNDIAGSFLPQQPPNVALFPKLLKWDNILFNTNPHMFSINGLLWLGTSGQNIADICRFRSMEGLKEIDILLETLEMRHLAPTCPDTLRSYPFEKEDPLVIENAPNVYFSCNAKEYNSQLIKQLEGVIRLFTVPTFSSAKEVVLLDIQTLETYSYRLDTADS